MELIVIKGNIGKKPELKYAKNGQAYCSFSLATNRKWVDGDGKKQSHTTWWRCMLWGKRAEGLAPYLDKGIEVLVIGRMNSNQYGSPTVWQGQNGPQASYEVTVNQFEFCGSGSGNQHSAAAVSGGDDLIPPEEDDFIDF